MITVIDEVYHVFFSFSSDPYNLCDYKQLVICPCYIGLIVYHYYLYLLSFSFAFLIFVFSSKGNELRDCYICINASV